MSWLAQILPYLEQGAAHAKIDFSVPADDPLNAVVAKHQIPILICPSNPQSPLTCFAGVHHDLEAPIDFDNHGVLFLNSRIRLPEDVPDGLGYTLFIGEMEGTPSWLVGDRHTLRNCGATPTDSATLGLMAYPSPNEGSALPAPDDGTAPLPPVNRVGGFGSSHPGGANFALGDGNVRFISQNIDGKLFRHLGHRADGALIGTF